MGAFQDGMRMGQNAWQDAQRMAIAEEEARMRQEAHRRAMEESDLRLGEARRVAGIQRRVDDETQGIATMMRDGTMTANRSGMSDASAQMLYGQGGQAAVDETASYGNVENVRMGLRPTFATSEPGAGTVNFRAYDPANAGDRGSLEGRLGVIAALRGDIEGIRKSQDARRAIREDQVFGEAVKSFRSDPNSMADYMKWVNKTNPLITVAPQMDGKKVTGYNLMTVSPSGDATHKFLSPAQAAQLAGATALMDVNPTRALEIIGKVDQTLAATIGALNGATNMANTANNAATHNANTDTTNRMNAQAHMASAGASQALSRSHAAVYDAQLGEIKQGRKDLTEARLVADEYELLDDKEKAGPKGQALVRKFNMLNAKPGGQVNLGSGGANANKLPQTLTDQEKEAYKMALGDIALIPVDKATGMKPPKMVAQAYKNYGLDPARFGLESELDKRLKAFQTGGTGEQAGGLAVPNRPFYSTPMKELQVMATKPRGVSSAQAMDAAEELRLRKGETRLGAF